jgi:hypothetical protein
MQLRNARLCLDCEEVHDAQQCPGCASETFAFVTRWVPAPERRGRPRPTEPERPLELEAYRLMLEPDKVPPSGWRLVKRGAVGLALFGLAGWIWRGGTPATDKDRPAANTDTGAADAAGRAGADVPGDDDARP